MIKLESEHKSGTQSGGNAPAVSVIVPAYNVAAYIADALASVFAQTFTNFEVIVINDGSPDTAELERVLEPFRESMIYIKQENRGPSGARNAGIRRARGQYVAFLDADDVWLAEYLSEQIQALNADPALDLIYADATLFGEGDRAGETFMDTCPSMGPVTLESLLSQRCVVITSCVVVRRQTLIDAGLFDENYYRSEDFDLWVRLVYAGARLSYQRKVLARHRLRPDSLAGDPERLHECAIEVYANLGLKLKLTAHERALVDNQIANYEFDLALSKGKRELRNGNHKQAAASLRSALNLKRTLGQSRLKLRLALLALRIAPAVAQGVYRRRHESAFATPTSVENRKRVGSLSYTVAHVMPWDAVGGTEHATLRIAQATSDAQLRHVMFCLSDGPAVKSLFKDAGFETVDYIKIEPSYRHAWTYLRES
ncbi:MAG: glycosyltransferase family 2 protein, partial [Acidobacteriota bacterium]|nr:glycosyltransferase family 2 protein [Acidobacteriota bacterium]